MSDSDINYLLSGREGGENGIVDVGCCPFLTICVNGEFCMIIKGEGIMLLNRI